MRDRYQDGGQGKWWHEKWFEAHDEAVAWVKEIGPRAWGVEITKKRKGGFTVRWYWRDKNFGAALRGRA